MGLWKGIAAIVVIGKIVKALSWRAIRLSRDRDVLVLRIMPEHSHWHGCSS